MTLIKGNLIWELHATHGMPLEIAIPMAANAGYMPTWLDLLYAASDDGAKWNILIPRLQDAIRDGYGSKTAQAICERLDDIMQMVKEQ